MVQHADNCGDNQLNLLIAEDRPEIQVLMKKLIDMWGHRADIVSNGLEALEHAKKGCYDLCIMDRHMPVMDGLTAIENIRRETPYFPIIMYSLEDPPSESFLFKRGIDEWVDKNTSPGYLRERIEEWGGTRTYSVVKEGTRIVIKKDMPLDAKHAEEIRELAKKGLIKMNFRGIGENETTMIVNKNIPDKIAQEFIKKVREILTSIDCNDDRPAI